MKKMNKKGFTIVELVIVVAVIAILSAVLIPTFSSVVHNANVSNDKTLVRNLNTALAANAEEEKTMQDALDAAAEFGYDVAKINNTKVEENDIVWDSEKNEFVYNENGALKGNKYWVISNTVSPDCSTYLYKSTLTTVNAPYGIDVSDETNAVVETINYTSSATQSVIIATASNETVVTVNAPNSNVRHDGVASEVIVEAVKGQSYHEFGKVEKIVLNSGRVVVENDAEVSAVVVEPAANATVFVKVEEPAAVKKVFSTDATVVEGVAPVTEFTQNDIDQALLFEGMGTENSPYLIYNLVDFQNAEIVTADTTDKVYFKVMEDFTDTADKCTQLSYADVDLNGHTITLATPHTFMSIMNDVKIHNGNIHWAGGLTLCSLPQDESANVKASFEDLNLTGKIITTNPHFGPIISYAYAASYHGTYEINANNINNTLNIINQNGNVGGLFGYIFSSKVSASVTNCTFAGSIQGAHAGGFFNTNSSPEAKPIVNSGNSVTGKLTASGDVLAFGMNGNYNPVKEDGTNDTYTAQNEAVDSTSASLVKLTASTDLISIDASTNEISVNAVENAEYYIVEIEYWVNRNSDGSGGYPRTIQVRMDNAGASGLKQLDFVQVETEPSADVELLDYDSAKIWEEDGVYKIYDPDFTMYRGNWYVKAYAYDKNDIMKAFQIMKR